MKLTQLINSLIEQLEDLVKKDTEKKREEIAKTGHKLLNEYFEEWMTYSPDMSCIANDLFVMHDIEGRKEPWILHMPIDNVKSILRNIKKFYEERKKCIHS